MSERAGRHMRTAQVPRHARARSVVAVGGAMAILVAVNGLVRQTGVGASGNGFAASPALPTVQMSKPSAWRCPGPLPVGKGKESSEISIVNGGTSTAGVTVTVSRTGPATGGAVRPTTISRARLEVRGDSQVVLRLARGGSAGFAAVSVETDSGGIGVAESIAGGSSVGGPVLLSSPCALGAAGQGYVATGSTYLGSDVRLSLYNPDATPAVVDVSISTGSTITSPSTFQGVVVPASGLAVLDLRRSVPQRTAVAVTATAVSGALVVGALETTLARVAVASLSAGKRRIRRLTVAGASLLVGPEHGLGAWAFAVGPSNRGPADKRVASTFAVYDPGTRPVLVNVTPPGRAGAAASLSAEVPAGGVVDFATPIGEGGTAPGSVIVSAHGGAPIVVARLETRTASNSLEELSATSGTAGPSDAWLVPGALQTPAVDDAVMLANPGAVPSTVTLLGLTRGTTSVVRLGTVVVRAGSQVEFDLASVLHRAPAFAIRLSATTPVLVEQLLTPAHGVPSAVGGIPVGG